ncbi:MAG: alanine racemase [Anaerolineales bacterium]|nr:alanine racemase [Anaerolineales bacterium]
MALARKYSTWVQVDLSAIETNLRYYLETTKRQIMAVVKANAYGHGAVAVSNAALNAGATWLAVARVEEALELRGAGIDAPVLILGHTPPEQVEAMIAADIALTVWDRDQIKTIGEVAAHRTRPAKLHLKVDTGMSRLGVTLAEAGKLAQAVARNPALTLEGVFTHYARADETDPEPTQIQLEGFKSLVESLDRRGLRPPLIHSANSAAGLAHPETWFDLIRVGIAMYGLQPSSARPLPGSFRPALSWRSSLSMVKTVPPGRGISYGHVYRTSGQERIGTVPVGYADGFRRVEGNQALVGGHRVPVVGRVTMDQIMLQLDAVPEGRVGEEVVLIGVQGEARITAEDIADRWGTINYEVTSGISKRVPRVYR